MWRTLYEWSGCDPGLDLGDVPILDHVLLLLFGYEISVPGGKCIASRSGGDLCGGWW